MWQNFVIVCKNIPLKRCLVHLYSATIVNSKATQHVSIHYVIIVISYDLRKLHTSGPLCQCSINPNFLSTHNSKPPTNFDSAVF